MIETLRKDGMTDDSLKRLQSGCRGCYVFSGKERRRSEYDERYWYAAVSIAPAEAKKDVVLEIQCPSIVRLHHTLYGG